MVIFEALIPYAQSDLVSMWHQHREAEQDQHDADVLIVAQSIKMLRFTKNRSIFMLCATITTAASFLNIYFQCSGRVRRCFGISLPESDFRYHQAESNGSS